MNLLFVCSGNTCRSPMAEYLGRKMLKEAGKTNVTLVSAGTSPAPWIEFPKEARSALKDEGVDNVRHQAKAVTADLVEAADWVLVMEDAHKRWLLKNFPESEGKIFLLKEFAHLGKEGIADPYGHPAAVYKSILGEIKAALAAIIPKLP